ncbi:MAG: glycosyltransferase family 4 protein [bacterium]
MSANLVYIVTSALSADVLLRGQLNALRNDGFEVTVIASPHPRMREVAKREGVTVVQISMEREISFPKDLLSLYRLASALRRLNPDIVNASTPKAGVLGMVAAKMVRVPARVYQQRGLRLQTATGFKYQVLLHAERMAAACAHYVVCNSDSLRQACVRLAIADASKTKVLGVGSGNGVDTTRFRPDAAPSSLRQARRRELGIPAQSPVVGFVGRLTRDKGIVDLIDAFDRVSLRFPQTYLLLVGPLDHRHRLPLETLSRLEKDPRIVVTGYVKDTPLHYSLMDVLVIPSYREGLPNAPLEAAACGVPVVGFRATGTVDVVRHGETGYLVPLGNSAQLGQRILSLLENCELRLAMGHNGREWVRTTFDSPIVWRRWIRFYREIACEHLQTLR